MNENIRIEFGDCRELLKTIPDNSVTLVVTSPPYNIGKKYGKYSDKISLEEWKELINDVTKEIYRVLKPNGSFFLNLSPIPLGNDKEILPLPYIGYDIMKDNNFKIRNIITWTFNNMQNCTNRLSGRYENIVWGVKDLNNYIFNLDEIRIPYITKNDKRLVGGIGRNPTDVWYFDRVNNMTKKKLDLTHPTIYPLPMIVRILKMSSNVGDTILDPFAGSGTSLVAAKILNRKAIGFELDTKYKNECERRLATEGNIPASVFDEYKSDEEKKQAFLNAISNLKIDK
jgi:modification methylase scaI